MPKLSDRTLILMLILLQLGVCLPFINSFPIALDEPFSIFWAQQDLGDMMNLFESENNPPLHFVLLHFWIKSFGIGPFAVRSLSLIFSLLTIPVVFRFARKLVNPDLAVLTVLLVICSRFNHYHALEARVYSLFVLLTAAAFFELYSILFENKKGYWVLTLCNVLLLYAHYLGGFVVGVEFILIFIFYKGLTKRKTLFFLLSGIFTVILYIPGITWFFQRLGNFSEKGTWVPEAQYSELYGNVIRFFNNTLSACLLLGIIFVFIVIFYKKRSKNRWQKMLSKNYLFVFLIFLIPYLGMFIFSKVSQPIFLDRYLLYTTIPLYLSFVLIVGLIVPENKTGFAFLLLIPMILTTKWIPENNREPDKEAKYVKENEDSETVKVICPPFYDLTFMYHYDIQAFADYRNFKNLKDAANVRPIYNYSDLVLESSQTGVFFIDGNSEFIYPDNNIKSGLDNTMTCTGQREFKGGVVIYSYN